MIVTLVPAVSARSRSASSSKVAPRSRMAMTRWRAASRSTRSARTRSSARWYLPLAPHVDEAYAQLRALAALRRSRRRARGLAGDPRRGPRDAQPLAAPCRRPRRRRHGDRRAVGEGARGRSPESARPPPTTTTAEREAWHRDRLARDTRAGLGALVLAGSASLLWLGGGLVLARRGIDATGGLVAPPCPGDRAPRSSSGWCAGSSAFTTPEARVCLRAGG